MKHVADSFLDERLRWPDDVCMHCNTSLDATETTREHVPSKCLLQKPYPAEMVTLEACRTCNEAFSRDEEYFKAFLWAVLAGSTDPEEQKADEVGRTLRRNSKLRERIENSRTERAVAGTTTAVFAPEMDRVKRVVVKNARGHALYELDRPMPSEPDLFLAVPLESLTPHQRHDFETTGEGTGLQGWSEIGTRMFQRQCGVACSDMMGLWIVVQNDVYRYLVVDDGDESLLVQSVVQEYLATRVCWRYGRR